MIVQNNTTWDILAQLGHSIVLPLPVELNPQDQLPLYLFVMKRIGYKPSVPLWLFKRLVCFALKVQMTIIMDTMAWIGTQISFPYLKNWIMIYVKIITEILFERTITKWTSILVKVSSLFWLNNSSISNWKETTVTKLKTVHTDVLNQLTKTLISLLVLGIRKQDVLMIMNIFLIKIACHWLLKRYLWMII